MPDLLINGVTYSGVEEIVFRDANGNETRYLKYESTYKIPAFWQNALNTAIATVKSLQTGKNCVTFAHFSDNHTRGGYSGALIAEAMKKCNIPFCFYNGDSISSGYIATEAEMIAQEEAFADMMTVIPDSQFCRSVGNHDGYWAVSASEKHTYTRHQNYELFFRKQATAQNKHFGGDGTYYYVEDLASKVRFIVLNTNGGSVDATQIAWFRDVALNVDEGWAVVVISHQPISNHYHAGISNSAEVRTIVTESKTEVIGWFSGHIHRDRIYTGVAVNTSDDSEGEDMGFKQITITSDATNIAYDDATKHTIKEDTLSHAIDFVTINRDTKRVNLTRLGIGNSRTYSYADTAEPENKLVPSTATLNSRMSGSSASVSAADGSKGSFVTDFIAVDEMESITPFNVRLNWELVTSGENKIVYFDSDKNRLGNGVYNTTGTKYTIANGETVFDAKDTNSDTSAVNWANVAYIRLQLFVKPSGTALTSADIADLTITFDHEATL